MLHNGPKHGKSRRVTSFVQYNRTSLPVLFWRVVFRNRTGCLCVTAQSAQLTSYWLLQGPKRPNMGLFWDLGFSPRLISNRVVVRFSGVKRQTVCWTLTKNQLCINWHTLVTVWTLAWLMGGERSTCCWWCNMRAGGGDPWSHRLHSHSPASPAVHTPAPTSVPPPTHAAAVWCNNVRRIFL